MRLVALIILVPGRASNSANVSSRESMQRFESADQNRHTDSVRVGRLEYFPSSGRPTRTEKRFESADPNRKKIRVGRAELKKDSSRPTRIGQAIRVGRPESMQRFAAAGPNYPNRKRNSNRPARINPATRVDRSDSSQAARINNSIRVGPTESAKRF